MCGIVAYVDKRGSTSIDQLQQMTDALEHRGPDYGESKQYNTRCGVQVGFGHRRLSILDLSESGNQPMEKHNFSIVFNGEIYNYEEIREELIHLNYSFKSNSDTEVVLSAIDHWGIENAIQRFNGMFAFIILDQSKETVLVVRDRAGVKPLYIYENGELLLMASELKAFHQHPRFKNEINQNSVAEYFRYSCIPGTQSIYKNVSKLEPGHYLEIELKTFKTKKTQYWNIFNLYNRDRIKLSREDLILEIEKVLLKACNYRMVSDVPVGVFLSGGYDSSAVTALLQKNSTSRIKTFTIGFEDSKSNEAHFAKEIASHLGTDHNEFYCTEKEAKRIIPKLPFHYDEPFGDSSAIPTILVSQFAKTQVKVALSADGGDEVFGGYNKYIRNVKLLQQLTSLPSFIQSPEMFNFISKFPFPRGKLKHAFEDISTFYKIENPSTLDVFNVTRQKTNEQTLNKFLLSYTNKQTPWFGNIKPNGRSNDYMLAQDYITYMMDDILVKVDRATMSCALEGREPLIDYNLIDLLSRVSYEDKIVDGNKKHLLKEITHKYIPKALLDRPKSGFSIPVCSWLKNDLSYLIDEYLNTDRIKSQGIFNHKYLEKIIRIFKTDTKRYDYFIWDVLMFQMWYEKWQD